MNKNVPTLVLIHDIDWYDHNKKEDQYLKYKGDIVHCPIGSFKVSTSIVLKANLERYSENFSFILFKIEYSIPTMLDSNLEKLASDLQNLVRLPLPFFTKGCNLKHLFEIFLKIRQSILKI